MTDSVGGQGPDGSDGAASLTHPAAAGSPPPTHPAARLAAELRTAAAGGYGKDWEDRGRSHLGEAALLLALLWPSGGTSPVSGTTVEQINANEPTHSAPHPQAQTGGQAHSATQPQSGSQSQPVSRATRHRWHEEHVRHEEHLEHVAHEEHVEHLAHLRREDGGDDAQHPRRGSRTRPRSRLHLAAAGGAAIVVVAAVAGPAVALTSHHGTGSSGGSTSAVAHAVTGGGGSEGGTATVPSFTASYTMTRHIISCVPAGSCITGPLPLTIVCHHDGSCTASSSHWASSKSGTLNGTSFHFSGIDTGVSGCDQPNMITLNLTVTAWSAGSAATRKPLALSGPYDVAGPATSGCAAWDLQATLTSQ